MGIHERLVKRSQRVRNRESFSSVNGTVFREDFPSSRGMVEIIDIIPENPIKGAPPVFVKPGWSSNATSYAGIIRELVDSGRRVITCNPLESPVRRGRKGRDRVEAELEDEAQMYLDALDHKGITQVDGLAHSEGSLAITKAAVKDPEKFRSIIFTAPAGFMPAEPPLFLPGRFGLNTLANVVQMWFGKRDVSRRIHQAASQAFSELLANPSRQARHGWYIPTFNIVDDLATIIQQGVKVAFITPKYDIVFFPRHLRRAAADLHAEFIEVESAINGHNSVVIHPDLHGKQINAFLSVLDGETNQAA